MSQSPLWSELLDRVEEQIAGRWQVRGPGPSSLQATSSVVARAHSQFLITLQSASSVEPETISQITTEAVELLIAVARVWGTFDARTDDRRVCLANQLRRRLAAQEDAVLAGEVTYHLWPDHGERPSAAMRQAINHLSRDPTAAPGDLLALSTAAVDLASLLVRLAANASATGRGDDAPEDRSAALDATLAALTTELAARAHDLERPAHTHRDLVAHHLAAGLRLRPPPSILKQPSAGSPDQTAAPADLDGLRDAWLELATNEYLALTGLDRRLETPAHDQSSPSLAKAIADNAAHVIYGGRLAGRPEAFRHARAWRHQTHMLTYALEAYVAGLRGHTPSLAHAQRITLTRLVRATVAIALTDLGRQTPPADTTAAIDRQFS